MYNQRVQAILKSTLTNIPWGTPWVYLVLSTIAHFAICLVPFPSQRRSMSHRHVDAAIPVGKDDEIRNYFQEHGFVAAQQRFGEGCTKKGSNICEVFLGALLFVDSPFVSDHSTLW